MIKAASAGVKKRRIFPLRIERNPEGLLGISDVAVVDGFEEGLGRGLGQRESGSAGQAREDKDRADKDRAPRCAHARALLKFIKSY